MKKTLLAGILLAGVITAQTYNVGDVVANFSEAICANGTGDWVLDNYNGDLNGGDYHVIWINLFTSW
ncbi:MAG: hypothetical protein ACE5D8_09000 [Fidelibacterota bacterium]